MPASPPLYPTPGWARNAARGTLGPGIPVLDAWASLLADTVTGTVYVLALLAALAGLLWDAPELARRGLEREARLARRLALCYAALGTGLYALAAWLRARGY